MPGPDAPDDPLVVVAPATVIAPPPEVPVGRTTASLSPKTTAEQDRTTAGQRAVNLTWEHTQRLIALGVTLASLMTAMFLVARSQNDSQLSSSLTFLYGVANLVIGFYFGRTNHTRTGGVGNGSGSDRER